MCGCGGNSGSFGARKHIGCELEDATSVATVLEDATSVATVFVGATSVATVFAQSR